MVDTSAAEPCAAAGMGDGPGPRRPPFTASGAFSPVVAQASASGQAEVSPCPSQEPPPRGPCSESGRYGSAAGQTRVGSGLPRRVDSLSSADIVRGHLAAPRSGRGRLRRGQKPRSVPVAPWHGNGGAGLPRPGARGARPRPDPSRWTPRAAFLCHIYEQGGRPELPRPAQCLPCQSGLGAGGQKVPLAETSHSRRTSHEVSRDISSQRQDLLASWRTGPVKPSAPAPARPPVRHDSITGLVLER